MGKLTILIFLLSLTAEAVGNCDSEGTDFLFSCPEVHVSTLGGIAGTCRVIITSQSAARAVVEVQGQSISNAVSISAGGAQVVDLPSTVRQTAGATQALAVTVTSNAKINVYAVNQAEQASDGTVIFPTSMLGKEYILGSFKGSWFGSQVSVVSKTSGNTVTLWKPDFLNVYVMNSTVTLNAGQAHLFQTKTEDLTGWKITSTANIAVLSGHSLTEVPSVSSTINSTSTGLNQYTMQASHLWEMMPPTSIWGTDHAVAPTPLRTLTSPQSHVRVIAKAATQVTLLVQNVTYSISQAGDFISFNRSADEEEYVQCDVDCLVVVYMTDFKYHTSSSTDAAMTVVPPVSALFRGSYVLGALDVNAVASQAVNQASFAWSNYILVLEKTISVASVAVSTPSTTLSASYTQMNNTDYSWAVYGPVNTAANTAVSVSCTECFAMMTGFQFSDSYAYAGGWKCQATRSTGTGLLPNCLLLLVFAVWSAILW